MRRLACGLVTLAALGSQALDLPGETTSAPPKKSPDGIYAVLRQSVDQKQLLPLKPGEAIVVDHHRYLKKEQSAGYVVVQAAPEVSLDLVDAPKGVTERGEVVRILFRLTPTAATALERLTRVSPGRQLAIVLDGEVVTVHKVREVIKGGAVQITSCAPGGAAYLLKQLQAHCRSK